MDNLYDEQERQHGAMLEEAQRTISDVMPHFEQACGVNALVNESIM